MPVVGVHEEKCKECGIYFRQLKLNETEQLMEIIELRDKKEEVGAVDAETVCIGLARVGADTQGRHVTDLIRVLLDFVLFKVNSDE